MGKTTNLQPEVTEAKALCDKVIVDVTRAKARVDRVAASGRGGGKRLLAEIQDDIGELSVQLDAIFRAATNEKPVR